MHSMVAQRMEDWKQRIRMEGRMEGKAALLMRLLERRFGALPGWARERIAKADADSIEAWGLRVLESASLEEVLR